MEPETKAFFLPGREPDEWESAYAALATRCDRATPPLNERIRSITFDDEDRLGEKWTAEVGATLSGTGYRTKRVHGKKVERRVDLPNDPATVLAIFPGELHDPTKEQFGGDPFLVVTDAWPIGNVGSEWENPIRALHPPVVIKFSTG